MNTVTDALATLRSASDDEMAPTVRTALDVVLDQLTRDFQANAVRVPREAFEHLRAIEQRARELAVAGREEGHAGPYRHAARYILGEVVTPPAAAPDPWEFQRADAGPDEGYPGAEQDLGGQS